MRWTTRAARRPGGRRSGLDGSSEASDDASEDGRARDGGRDGDADEDEDPDAPPPIVDGSYLKPCLGPDPADADLGAPSATYPAFKPSVARAQSAGGTVLTDATIVPITFSDDTASSTVQDFVARLGASSYWASFASEYGLHAPKVTPVPAAEAAPKVTTDGIIQNWLLDKLDGTHPEFPPPTANSVYVLFYPVGTRIIGGGMINCKAPPIFRPPQPFTDYYAVTNVPNKPQVLYAVVPRCSDLNSWAPVDETTMSASHAIIGAITNPYGDGFSKVDTEHFIDGFLKGPNPSDLCGVFPNNPPRIGRPGFRAPDFDFLAQRQWSNAAGATGTDPCVPAPPTDAYFNANPVGMDDVEFALGDFGPFITSKGMHIPVGRCGIIELDVFSDKKTDTPIEFNAYELRNYYPSKEKLSLQFSFNKTTAVNGEKIYLEVGVMRHVGCGLGCGPKFPMFTVQATVNGKSNYWPIGVVY